MPIYFDSLRFSGDPVLEDILNDPDTGTKKLQAGSNADSVKRLQKALFDLGWSKQLNPPIRDEAIFVDGYYGPKTTDTVLDYKTHYNIQYPYGGLIDGLAGPRTLKSLDPQCVLWDEAYAAIIQKVADLNAAGIPTQLGYSTPDPILGTSGAISAIHLMGQIAIMWYKRGIGAFEVHGNIRQKYSDEGGATGILGFPISDEHDDVIANFRISDFENGSLRCDLATGIVEVVDLRPPLPDDPPVF